MNLSKFWRSWLSLWLVNFFSLHKLAQVCTSSDKKVVVLLMSTTPTSTNGAQMPTLPSLPEQRRNTQISLQADSPHKTLKPASQATRSSIFFSLNYLWTLSQICLTKGSDNLPLFVHDTVHVRCLNFLTSLMIEMVGKCTFPPASHNSQKRLTGFVTVLWTLFLVSKRRTWSVKIDTYDIY